jgi:hypothetical protein
MIHCRVAYKIWTFSYLCINGRLEKRPIIHSSKYACGSIIVFLSRKNVAFGILYSQHYKWNQIQSVITIFYLSEKYQSWCQRIWSTSILNGEERAYSGILQWYSVRWIMRTICTSSDVKELSISPSELVNMSKCVLPVTEGITRLYRRA